VRPSKPSMKEICGEGRLDSSQACDVLTDLCCNEYSSGCRATDCVHTKLILWLSIL
jgi:hypothetical protein